MPYDPTMTTPEINQAMRRLETECFGALANRVTIQTAHKAAGENPGNATAMLSLAMLTANDLKLAEIETRRQDLLKIMGWQGPQACFPTSEEIISAVEAHSKAPVPAKQPAEPAKKKAHGKNKAAAKSNGLMGKLKKAVSGKNAQNGKG